LLVLLINLPAPKEDVAEALITEVVRERYPTCGALPSANGGATTTRTSS
jgi:hypothetical protein